MKEYPGRDMPEFPIEWYVIDDERGWVVCQVWNRMRDPGDGSRAPGVQLHPPQVRRGRQVVLRGGHLQPAALRRDGRRVGGRPGRGSTSRRPERYAGQYGSEPWSAGDSEGPVTTPRWPSSVVPRSGTPIRRVDRAAFDTALGAGVNHLDVAPQYGRAQELLGPLVPAVRGDLFVACKTLRRDPDGVRAQLDESLRLLGCEYFDLYQLHAVTDLEELDARRGAVEAILEARDEGRCHFAGITGHGLDTPAAQLEALRRYDLDTVMFPVNPQLWSDTSYRRDAEALLQLAEERDLGVMAIKAAAARPWAGRPPTTTTWYEPYTSREEVARGVGFALSTPGVQALCTPSDLASRLAPARPPRTADAPVALSAGRPGGRVRSDPVRAFDLPDAGRLRGAASPGYDR